MRLYNKAKIMIQFSHVALRPSRTGVVLLLLFLPFALAAQSGWTKKKGEFFGQWSASYFSSDQYYNLSGELLETSTFRHYGTSLYGEYGLTDRLTVIANWPTYKFNSFETTETVSGLGDLGLGLKYGLPLGGVPVSITITPELPTGWRKTRSTLLNSSISPPATANSTCTEPSRPLSRFIRSPFTAASLLITTIARPLAAQTSAISSHWDWK
jgi:hypothetical protein